MADEITDQMVTDLLGTALEGASNYWIRSVRAEGATREVEFVQETLVVGGVLHVRTDEDKVITLDRPRFEAAIRFEATRRGELLEDLYDNHDAGVADCILQQALFGEQVYA